MQTHDVALALDSMTSVLATEPPSGIMYRNNTRLPSRKDTQPMTTTESPTLDQVLTLATRLSAGDKLRLIARLAPQVAQVLPAPTAVADDLLAELDDLIAESAALGPTAQDSAAIISEMRR